MLVDIWDSFTQNKDSVCINQPLDINIYPYLNIKKTGKSMGEKYSNINI